MSPKFYISFLALLLFGNLSAQEYRYFGILKVDGMESRPISYMLQFDIGENSLQGNSLTDLLGSHETKNRVEGKVDLDKGIITFSEKEIMYTVSTVSDELFCFVNFEGEIITTSKSRTQIIGSFKGEYPDGKNCATGTMDLVGDEAIKQLVDRANKKIQRSNEVPDSLKEELDVTEFFDSTYVHQLDSGDNVNLFSSEETVRFEIWDGSNEDGDVINFYRDDQLILEQFMVRKKKYVIETELTSDINTFKIEAMNQGEQGLNTVMIDVQGNMNVQFRSNLKKGEFSSVSIVKEK